MIQVGLIGIGKMGLPIACNLLERGFPVTGYRRSGTAQLEAAGGRGVGSPAEVAAASDVLVSILPTAEDVEQVVLGPAGTLSRLRPGTVHIEMSTIDVGRKRALRDRVAAAGGELLDCPISGSPGMVGPRKATTFVSGPVEAVERVRPVLEALSGPWVHTGVFGTAAQMKYVANLLLAVHTVAAAEALVLAEACGLDTEVVQQALDSSIAGSAVLRQRGPVMRSRSWLPTGGPIETLSPILDQVADTAATTGVSLPLFGIAKAAFDRASAQGWGHLDIAAVRDLVTSQDALTAPAGPSPT